MGSVDLVLEKPIAPTAQECCKIDENAKKEVRIMRISFLLKS